MDVRLHYCIGSKLIGKLDQSSRTTYTRCPLQLHARNGFISSSVQAIKLAYSRIRGRIYSEISFPINPLLLQGVIYCRKHLFFSEELLIVRSILLPSEATFCEVAIAHIVLGGTPLFCARRRRYLLTPCSARRVHVSRCMSRAVYPFLPRKMILFPNICFATKDPL